MNLAHWLVRTAQRCPDAPALMRGTAVVADYRRFADRAARLGGLLGRAYGIVPGDRVAIYMGNRPEYLELLYGIWFCGAVAVPINAKLHPREAAFILEDCGCRLVFVQSGHGAEKDGWPKKCHTVALDELEGGWAESPPLMEPAFRRSSDLAWLFYTSGTTGTPKGVMLSFGNLAAMSYAYLSDVDDVFDTDAALYAAPISHGAGLYNFIHVLRGSRHVVPESGGFDGPELCALIPQLDNVSMFAAPTMVKRLLSAAQQAGWHGDGLRTVVYGGGPMYVADIEAATDWFGDRFVQIYGQGECPMAISALSRADIADRDAEQRLDRLGSVGRVQSCVEVAILDADGNGVPLGDIGEIAVRGTPVMAGYWGKEDATAATLRDGWLWTGDMGSLDASGYLTLRDRSKDLIISGGSNVYPREVEDCLLTHPAISEVAVIGRPSEDWGEEVTAFLVVRDGHVADSKELDAHCRARIAVFKCPKSYTFVKALPKNNYGKIEKTTIRTTRWQDDALNNQDAG